MYRKFHHKTEDAGTRWRFYPDNPAGLKRQVMQFDAKECYHTLNVWPDFTNERVCYYDYGFDFDNKEDIRHSAKDAVTIFKWLWELGVRPNLYYSGSKGIHIVVAHQAAGLTPREDGGLVCKMLQLQLQKKLDTPSLDTGIHGSVRMWRVPNTINAKSALYKVAITLSELEDIARDGIEKGRELAKAPRPDNPLSLDLVPQFAAVVKSIVPEADMFWAKLQMEKAQKEAVEFAELPACIENILRNPERIPAQAAAWGKQTPSRNKLTQIAAAFFRSHMKIPEAQTQALLGANWQAKVAKLSTSTLVHIKSSTETCVSAVYKNNYFFSCGTAITHGCRCSPACPMWRPYEPDRQTDGDGNGAGGSTA